MTNKSNIRPSFNELKSRVGIEEVAYYLGYRINKAAGIGRYIEMELGHGKDRRDSIVIKKSQDKSKQTFFRRDGSFGDVVTLIKDNLNYFSVTGKSDWDKVSAVLHDFANIPFNIVIRNEFSEHNSSANSIGTFDSSRYKLREINMDDCPRLLTARGFDRDTIQKFSPYVRLVFDKSNEKFKGYNIAFPYSTSTEEFVGLEIRGSNGFKSKAKGTNSSTGCWVADFSGGDRDFVSAVYLFESAYDAMAFYQVRRETITKDIALCSLGGSVSSAQITELQQRFPNAKLHECFDNDLAGRINALRTIATAENFPILFKPSGDNLIIEAGGKEIAIDKDKSLYPQLTSYLSLKYKVASLPPPDSFKDWNDVLLRKRLHPSVTLSKEMRDTNLREQRQSSNSKIKL